VSGVKTWALALQSSAGSGSAGNLVALNSSGLIDSTMLPASTSGATTITATASTAISAGQLVNIYNNSGTVTIKPADSTSAGSQANGFCNVAIASSATGTVCLSGLVTGLSGLTTGTVMYLGTVGAVTATAPSTSGNVIQPVGTAASTTSMEFVPDYPITVQ
jgi:hypothetical protein